MKSTRICALDDLGSMVDVSDDLIESIVQLSNLKVANIAGAVGTEQTDFRSDHGDGLVCAHAAFLHDSVLRIEAGRNIDRNDNRAQLVQRGNPNGERWTNAAMEPGAENSIHNDIGASDKLCKLIARRPHHNGDVAPGSSPRNVASKSARDLIGLDRSHDSHVDILLAKNVGCNPSVTAVISKTGQHENTFRVIVGNDTSDMFTRMLHKLCFRRTLAFDDIFKLGDFISRENGPH